MRINILISLACILMHVAALHAQPVEHITGSLAGKVCPEISLEGMKYGPKVKSVKELKGKWVVLDFWSKACSACAASFPKVNDIQKTLGDKLWIILIGNNDRRNKGLELMYEKFRVKQNLELAVKFDSTLFQRFGLQGVPQAMIIDPNGVVLEVTAEPLEVEKLSALVEGKPVQFRHHPNIYEEEPLHQEEKDIDEGVMLSGSYFTAWHPEDPMKLEAGFNRVTATGVFKVDGVSLNQLYFYAFFGRPHWLLGDSLYGNWHNKVVIESGDKSLLTPDYDSGKNLFSYYLKPAVNNPTADQLKEMIRNDLFRQFGFHVSIEERKMPIWSMTATEDAKRKLKTHHTVHKKTGDDAGYCLENAPVRQILSILSVYHHGGGAPFIDNTGIETRIDICIDALMTDFEDIRKNLRSQGIIFTKKMREMKVLVLRQTLVP